MRPTRLPILLLLSLYALLGARGGTTAPRRFDVRDGLFNNQARMVVAMPDRRMLVYVDGMCSLFDGSRFQNLSVNRDKRVRVSSFLNFAHYFDRHQRLWIRYYHDLYAIDAKTYAFLDAKALLAPSGISEPIETFFIDQDGDAWVLTSGERLYHYDWQHPARLITQLRSARPEGNRPTICDICETGGLHYVFYSDGMMRCWNSRNAQMLFERRVTSTQRGYRLKASRWDDRHLILRTDSALVLYDVATGGKRVICDDANVMDWTASPQGLCYVTRREVWLRGRDLAAPRLLCSADNDWQGVALDWQGGVWACAFNKGVFYFGRGHGRSLVRHIPLPADSAGRGHSVRSILAYDAQTSYVLTDRGLFRLRGDTATPALPGLSGNQLTRDSRGGIWIPTLYGGLLRYDPATRATEDFSARAGIGGNCNFCHEMQPGVLLLCSHNNVLGVLDTDRLDYKELNKHNEAIFHFRYIVSACPMEGGYLVGSQNGFFFYDPKTGCVDTARVAPLNANRYSDKCNCLMRDREGHIWIGTQYGLLRYSPHDGNRVRRYAENEGLGNCCIQAVAEDKRGTIWATTADGLAYMPRGGRRFHFVLRNGDEPLRGGSFAERAAAATPDGHILLGTTAGLLELNPDVVFSDTATLQPRLMTLDVMRRTPSEDGQQRRLDLLARLDSTGRIRLGHTENYVTLRFSTLNYAYPERTLYRYRMDGIDHGWTTSDAGQGGLSVSYPALPPGDYTLHVQASSFGITWGREFTLHLSVAPPWWRAWWAVSLYALAVVALAALFVRHYVRQRNAKLEARRREEEQRDRERLNEMKFRFFTNISHEFRTPLTLIITPLQTLLEQDGLPEHVSRTLALIKRSAQTLNSLISQLLDFRALEQGGQRLQPSIVQLGTVFDTIGPAFAQLAQERGMTFTLDTDGIAHATFHLDVPKFQKIVSNLLSNAFKFTPDGGTVSVKAWMEDGELRLSVSDTGIGIKREEQAHIFERFYQAEGKQQGTVLNTGSGIGLNLVSGYVNLMHGSIEVESTYGEGSTFRVRIPDIPSSDAEPAAAKTADATGETEEADSAAGGAVKLLVVEDNRDFRTFMVQALQGSYKVYAAADGEEALSTARVAVPDLIVSDVMMPRMDGYQLCRAVKSDIRLSHIPLVLLTAKNTDEGRTDGYLSGADAYITKPFNMSVLQACLTMLLDQRRERQREFEREESVNPQKLTITPLDEQFLRKAVDCMERNMGNPDYDVQAFSGDMAMERTTLYRKMVAVVGKTPLQFMHAIRMKRALRLVETGLHSVADVAAMVGYNSTKTFSQHFKNAYGEYPSQYNKEKNH